MNPQPSTTTQPPATRPTTARPSPTAAKPSTRTILTLAVSLLVVVAFDRLVIAAPFRYASPFTPIAVFWIAGVAATTLLHWRTAIRRPMTWFVATAVVACAVWTATDMAGAFATYDVTYPLTMFVAVPALLMLHLQLVNGRFDVWRPAGVALRWLTGWAVQPFSGLGAFGRAVAGIARITTRTVSDGDRRPTLRRIGLAAAIAVPTIIVLGTLLASADMVFAYALSRLAADVDVTAFAWHAGFVLAAFPFMFSLLANQDMRGGEVADLYGRRVALSLDPVVTAIVLGAVLALYVVFCAVQFAFLFAGAGLPDGMTYAEYARGGFFQLLLVAAIDLGVFGVVLSYAPRTRTLTAMLVALVAATGVMLVSAGMRLGLYVGAYGLTWLRFASLTFIGLLAVVLVLCLVKTATVRMRVDRLPLVATCLVLFVVWYVALGWCDPMALVDAYNASHGFDAAGAMAMM
ncbi:DUF4153 domain-containing protein [Bifidobacterium stellenboschense]|uniref:Membrane protein n=1 Tax=Bifidobacterium stellenboschense TaxID=762211 RepID=A0A087D989_9BIFI|nr:DUF4173 domain-containing protein [Bifidobacterium stellenboschense]KFI92089.1 membrane protein [Bifidobacterium stellenboschense]